ncbi:hypothetical protein INR49_017120 [Caranx melampygus]|nr:hypothetical protein INR49_017120 [Caranx melampygus]
MTAVGGVIQLCSLMKELTAAAPLVKEEIVVSDKVISCRGPTALCKVYGNLTSIWWRRRVRDLPPPSGGSTNCPLGRQRAERRIPHLDQHVSSDLTLLSHAPASSEEGSRHYTFG